MRLFLVNGELSYSYEQLLRDIQGTTFFHTYLHTDDVYAIFKNMLVGLLTNQEVILLDSDFTEDEVSKMIGGYEKTNYAKTVELKVNSFEMLLDSLRQSTSTLGLFTSGTTGTPKLIRHQINTFTRSVRTGDKYKHHKWGLAYNPTHMAGIQVFFQAFFNQNLLVKLFGLKNKEILESIQQYELTHLSATPTFYRLLNSVNPVASVVRVTFGGEKSDESLYEKTKRIFPNAKINNIYATTEFGALFISDGAFFKIDSQNKDFVKIENNVLYVHQSFLSSDATLTSALDGEWYCTNDKVEIVEEHPIKFRFVSRVSSTVNIGGYNVDPKETEDILQQHNDVKIARVYVKPNKVLGNMLVAEVVPVEGLQLKEKGLIDFLGTQLQAHKIPRIIKIVDKIELTRTGKIKQ
jgi:acyl-coenzyme A synthetase/AMP-(fatty) acid ligase